MSIPSQFVHVMHLTVHLTYPIYIYSCLFYPSADATINPPFFHIHKPQPTSSQFHHHRLHPPTFSHVSRVSSSSIALIIVCFPFRCAILRFFIRESLSLISYASSYISLLNLLSRRESILTPFAAHVNSEPWRLPRWTTRPPTVIALMVSYSTPYLLLDNV